MAVSVTHLISCFSREIPRLSRNRAATFSVLILLEMIFPAEIVFCDAADLCAVIDPGVGQDIAGVGQTEDLLHAGDGLCGIQVIRQFRAFGHDGIPKEADAVRRDDRLMGDRVTRKRDETEGAAYWIGLHDTSVSVFVVDLLRGAVNSASVGFLQKFVGSDVIDVQMCIEDHGGIQIVLPEHGKHGLAFAPSGVDQHSVAPCDVQADLRVPDRCCVCVSEDVVHKFI